MAEMSKSCCALSPVCGGVMGCWSAGGPFGVGAPLGSIIITTPSPVVPGLPPPWGGLKGPLWSMSLDGNESVILWCRGSVVLVPIPQLPPNPACSAAQPPPPAPPPAHPTDLLRRLQVPLCPTEQIRGGGGKKQPTKQAVRSGHPHTAPRQRGTTSAPHTPAMGERNVTPPLLICPTHTPSRRQHMRWPSTTHSTAATASGTSSVTRKAGSRSWGGDKVGGWKSPLPSNTPGPHTSPGAVGVGSTRSWKGEGGQCRAWPGGVGGCGVDLTRVRLHQQMAKWGANVS